MVISSTSSTRPLLKLMPEGCIGKYFPANPKVYRVPDLVNFSCAKKFILDESFLTNENSKENLFVVCGINSEVEDTYGWREQEQYYLEVTISDFKAGPGSIYFSGRDGNLNLKDDCTIKGEGLPVCVNRQFYTYGEKGGSSLVKILSIVKKTDKNVR